MNLGAPGNLTIYELLQDQGSVIAGILALVAGLAAYRAGGQQVKAVREQNHELKQNERHRQARETLIAARLLYGILVTVADSIEAILALGDDQRDLGIAETTGLRGKLPALVLDPVVDHLGKLNPQTIKYFFLLHAKIDHFRAPAGSATTAGLSGELEEIQKIVDYLKDAIAQESNDVETILDDTSG